MSLNRLHVNLHVNLSNAPTVAESPRNGKIITFYSYKGGTGRSMALANVAWSLAYNGKKVLTIDWDLEAPGLHRYFYPFLVDKSLAFSDGLINFVHNYKIKALSPPAEGESAAADWFVKYADITKYAVALKREFPEGGKIDFVPAGRQDESYSTLVNLFNWEDFYGRLGGNQFIDAAVGLMRQQYDYILIDSRTGVSDTSGICTVKMPDALVVCFTLNYQGINGAAAVADYVYDMRVKSAADADSEPNGKRQFNIFPVPMRLEDAQSRKLERRRDYARLKKFNRYPLYLHGGKKREDYWADVRINYSTFYAYEEILAAFGEKEGNVTSLLAAIERLTTYLMEGEVYKPIRLPQPDREDILKQFEGDTYEPGAIEEKSGQAAEMAYAGLRPEDQEMARRILLRLVRVAGPNETEHTGQLVSLSEFDPAAQTLIQTLRSYQLLYVESETTASEPVVRFAAGVSPREWKHLNDWIEGDKDFLLWRQSLREQASLWVRSNQTIPLNSTQIVGRDLLRGVALSMARIYLQTRRSDLSAAERNYIEAGIAQQTRERLALASEAQEQAQKVSAKQLEIERHRRAQDAKKKWSVLKNLRDRFRTARPTESSAAPPESENVRLAKGILRGTKALPDEILALAKKLKQEKSFSYARRVLARARADSKLDHGNPLKLRIYQESALCTYKDTDLPVDRRLDLALDILRQVEDFAQTKNQETLGLVGAIYKRKWEIDNQKQQLERSLSYYLRGYEQDPVNDQGYTGINAAFLLDLLASQEAEEARRANIKSDVAETRRAQARRIREDLVRRVAPLISKPQTGWLADMWWFYCTVAEALFGLQRYDDAVMLLQQGKETIGQIPEWEYETTVRQLARLAMLQNDHDQTDKDFEETPAWIALKQFFGQHIAPVRTAFLGKFGLALSGGGFRASLFHIGMLAKLAELDILRHVEVLSCVSGGAIIGAHYYLEVRELLQSKPDEAITQQDYIDIVQRIQRDFLAGVQRNIRTRVAAEFITNLKMIFSRNYSRTMRAGELYERELFSRVMDGESGRPRWLDKLFIKPLGAPADFNPQTHNWRRAAKAPMLILNATTLNTGHNWQFTVSWMGEPPTSIDSKIDGNENLRRMYYREAPEPHQHIRLGHAVAASSCVPVIFEPMVLEALYPERTVLLVDGGVCDNQGVSGLLEQDCTVVLVSDGSGQMVTQRTPSQGLLGVPLRTNDILQARVREAQYNELRARRRSSLLRGFVFIHLKDDLDVNPVDWLDCLDPYDPSDDARPSARKDPQTPYGIARELQAHLSAIRTDLDSFTDLEAYALMTSAYLMTESHFKNSNCIDGFRPAPTLVAWDFLALRQSMQGAGRRYVYLKNQLSISNRVAFKIWKLSPRLQNFSWLLGIAVVGLLVWLGYRFSSYRVLPEMTIGNVGLGFLALSIIILFAYLLGKRITRIRWWEWLVRFSTSLAMSILGWLLARVHLYIFDRWFLRLGSLKTFQRQRDT